MTDLDDVTVLVVNYRTLELTRRCVESLLQRYPGIRLLLIDNGSGDASADYVRQLAGERGNVTAILNERNLYHGPALDQGVRACTTPYVFTLDSDCEVARGGFLERMRAPFQDPRLYAVGELRYKGRYGYTFGYGDGASRGRRRRIPYIHPWAMLLDGRKYLTLRPFIHHGAPCIKNMRDAQDRGYNVMDFPISEFIIHHLRGTSSRHGYGLWAGGKQRIAYYLDKLEGLLTGDRTLDPLGRSKGRR